MEGSNGSYFSSFIFTLFVGGGPRGVIVKAMDYGIVVREFILLPRYYAHFRANTPGERYVLPYPLSYGSNSTTHWPSR